MSDLITIFVAITILVVLCVGAFVGVLFLLQPLDQLLERITDKIWK